LKRYEITKRTKRIKKYKLMKRYEKLVIPNGGKNRLPVGGRKIKGYEATIWTK